MSPMREFSVQAVILLRSGRRRNQKAEGRNQKSVAGVLGSS